MLTSAVSLVLCVGAGGSEQLSHDAWGGSSSLFKKAFFCVQKMVRNHRGRSSRGTISCVTNGCQLRGRSPKVRCLTRLGAHTNLDWARRVCVDFGVCITTAVIKKRFVNNRQADQACTEPRGTHASGSMSVGEAIARGTGHPYVCVSCASFPTPLN